MNTHPMFSVLEMIKKSSMVAEPNPDEFLIFSPQVARIRQEASQIASHAKLIKGLTTMNRVDLRASAQDLRDAADRLEKIAREEEYERLCGCFELGDLSEAEFSRAARHLGVDEHSIGDFIQWVNGEQE